MRLLAVVLAALLLLAGLFSVHSDRGAHGLYAQQDWTPEQRAQAETTIAYLDGADADLSFYTAEERSHLADVQRLMNIARFLFGLLALLLVAGIIVCYRQRCPVAPALFWGGVGALACIVLLGILMAFDFSWFWSGFHAVLFPQGDWLFPRASALITLFPPSFFEAYALQVLLASASFGLVSLLAGLMLRTQPAP